MSESALQRSPTLLVVLVHVRVSQAVQRAADDCLRLLALRHDHRVESAAGAKVTIAPHEVVELRTVKHHVCQPGVVIIPGGDVTIGAHLRLTLAAYRVGYE